MFLGSISLRLLIFGCLFCGVGLSLFVLCCFHRCIRFVSLIFLSCFTCRILFAGGVLLLRGILLGPRILQGCVCLRLFFSGFLFRGISLGLLVGGILQVVSMLLRGVTLLVRRGFLSSFIGVLARLFHVGTQRSDLFRQVLLLVGQRIALGFLGVRQLIVLLTNRLIGEFLGIGLDAFLALGESLDALADSLALGLCFHQHQIQRFDQTILLRGRDADIGVGSAVARTGQQIGGVHHVGFAVSRFGGAQVHQLGAEFGQTLLFGGRHQAVETQ